MLPISYDRHCMGCHQDGLKVPKEATASDVVPPLPSPYLPHESLIELPPVISAQLANALADDAKFFKKKKQGVRTVQVGITMDEWVAKNMTALANIPPADPSRFSPADGSTISRDALVAFYTAAAAYGSNSCNQCHTMTGTAPMFDTKLEQSQPLDTVLTGIPADHLTPKRWYRNSWFDHQKHAAFMKCTDCHSKLDVFDQDGTDRLPGIQDQTTQNAFIAAMQDGVSLLPGITWTAHTFEKKKSDGTFNVRPVTKSCTDCHSPTSTSQFKASSDCLTCHDYHDRGHAQPQPTVASGPAD